MIIANLTDTVRCLESNRLQSVSLTFYSNGKSIQVCISNLQNLFCLLRSFVRCLFVYIWRQKFNLPSFLSSFISSTSQILKDPCVLMLIFVLQEMHAVTTQTQTVLRHIQNAIILMKGQHSRLRKIGVMTIFVHGMGFTVPGTECANIPVRMHGTGQQMIIALYKWKVSLHECVENKNHFS